MSQYDPRVDQAQCIGCGLCPDMLPEVFTIRDFRGSAIAYDKDGWKPDQEEQLQLAEDNCPVGAIHIDAQNDAD